MNLLIKILITGCILCISNICYASKPILDEAIKQVNELNIDTEIKQDFISEIKQIYHSNNKGAALDIDNILVLSGRSSYLKVPIDAPHLPDHEDDYNRMRLGVELAKEITSIKSKLNINQITFEDINIYGPSIIYDGRREHNYALKIALKEHLLNDFPEDKFIILDLDPSMYHTKGQFERLKKGFDFSNKHIAIITHAYHFPRVARMVGNKPPYNYLGHNVKISFYLVDRKFDAPGALNDLVGEALRIDKYYKKGDLNKQISQEGGLIIY
jgi:hypothetical protein